jgi:hypothetical protein
MQRPLPVWALQRAGPADLNAARAAHARGTLQVTWPALQALRGWARQQGWPAPRFGFQPAFLTTLLANADNFQTGLSASGLELYFPRLDYALSPERLSEFDALYAARSAGGRPSGWGQLVAGLRELRRVVEAGVELHVPGTPPLRTWSDYYAWAHARYHMLEDGYDQWIGDDRS